MALGWSYPIVSHDPSLSATGRYRTIRQRMGLDGRESVLAFMQRVLIAGRRIDIGQRAGFGNPRALPAEGAMMSAFDFSGAMKQGRPS